MLKTWTRMCYVVFETTIDAAQSPSTEESFGADSLMNTQKTFQCKKLNNAGLVLVRITTAMSLDLFFFVRVQTQVWRNCIFLFCRKMNRIGA